MVLQLSADELFEQREQPLCLHFDTHRALAHTGRDDGSVTPDEVTVDLDELQAVLTNKEGGDAPIPLQTINVLDILFKQAVPRCSFPLLLLK